MCSTDMGSVCLHLCILQIPIKKTDFKEGLGRITNKGKQDQFQLGKQLRRRYDGFLTTDTNEVKARSSGRDRCIESIQTNLAGLYAPKGDHVWNKNLNWQPVPIQSMPVNMDGMLYEDAVCKKDDEVLEDMRKTGEGKEVMDKYGDLMKFLQEKSGKKMTDWVSVRDLLDTLTIEKSLGLVIPDWVTEDIWTQMQECAKFTTLLNYKREDRIMFRAGLILKDMTNHIKDVINNKAGIPKLYMYASHDVLVAAFMSAFDVFNGLAIPSSTAVVTEVHKLSDDDFRMKLFFRNNTDNGVLVPQKVPGCDNDGCTFAQWEEKTSKFIPKDWRHQCGESPLPGSLKLYDEF